MKTIEGVLFKALVDAGAVSQDNADDPVKVSGLESVHFAQLNLHPRSALQEPLGQTLEFTQLEMSSP